MDLLLNATFNDISVIQVTAHRKLQCTEVIPQSWRGRRCAGGRKKKFDLRSGSHAKHFLVFFNVPVQAPTRGQLFLGYSEKPSHFRRLLRRTWGYGGSISHFKPRVPTGVLHFKIKFWNHLFMNQKRIFKILYYVLHVRNWFEFKNIELHSDIWSILLVFYYIKYFCDICSEMCFYFHKRNKCMNFMIFQNKLPLHIHVYLVMGRGLVIGMSRVRIPLSANQERAYLVWKGS